MVFKSPTKNRIQDDKSIFYVGWGYSDGTKQMELDESLELGHI